MLSWGAFLTAKGTQLSGDPLRERPVGETREMTNGEDRREPTGLCRLVRWEPPSTGIPVVPGPRRSGLPSLESPHEGTVRAFGSSTLKNPTEKNSFFEGKDRSSEAIQERRSCREEGPMRGGPTAGQLESPLLLGSTCRGTLSTILPQSYPTRQGEGSGGAGSPVCIRWGSENPGGLDSQLR